MPVTRAVETRNRHGLEQHQGSGIPAQGWMLEANWSRATPYTRIQSLQLDASAGLTSTVSVTPRLPNHVNQGDFPIATLTLLTTDAGSLA